MSREWTEQQLNAINARGGSVLVSAAAGSGKTAVLVERVIRLITDADHPIDADRLLVVAFPRDAAAEMKQRIAKSLSDLLRDDPFNAQLLRQSKLLYSASICTIDSFCGDLVRDYFHILGVSADYRIADQSELELLKAAAMDSAMEDFYNSDSDGFTALLDAFAGKGGDRNLRETVLKIHGFLETQPFPGQWLDDMLQSYGERSVTASLWGKIIIQYASPTVSHCINLCENSISLLQEADEKLRDKLVPIIEEDLVWLQILQEKLYGENWDAIVTAVHSFSAKQLRAPRGYKDDPYKLSVAANRDNVKETVKRLQQYFCRTEDEARAELGELQEPVGVLFALTRHYIEQLDALKRKKNVLTFSDIELLAVRLLAVPDGKGGYEKTPQGAELARRFDAVIVDEFQDVNDVQNLIFNCMSQNEENLFTVGDVKQCIYGFRQAKPQIFVGRKESYARYDANNPVFPSVIILDKNFRSRAEVCDTVNFIFSRIMPDYTPEEYLNFGAEGYAFDSACDTELALIEKSNFDESSSKTALEARYTASRIWQMINAGVTVTEGDHKRPITFRDFAVLMRAKSGASNEDESKQKGSAEFVRQLAQYGIPAYCEESGDFFRAQEIRLVLNLLRVIDNPSNDVALLAVLLSPLFGFTPDDLAVLRLAGERASLYRCLNLCREDDSATGRRSDRFLTELSRLRDLAAVSTVDDLLEALYERTAIIAVTSAINGGKAPARNLDLMRVYARKFASNGYKTLSDFNSYIDRLMQSEKQLASASDAQGGAADCVQVMSIHKSKGLEYPVCFLVDTAREFNMMDLKEPILMDSEAYVGVKPYINYARRSTFPYTAIRMRKKRESIDEEMRMLYVALTRAREKLIIVGTAEEAETKLFKPIAAKTAGGRVEEKDVYAAKSMLEWLLLCAAVNPSTAGVFAGDRAGESDTNWILHKIMTEEELYSVGEREEQEEDNSEKEIKPDYAALLRENLAFVYPDADIIGIPQKVNPSQVSHSENREFTARALVMPVFAKDAQKRSPTEIGTAHHEFLHYCDFNAARADIEAEIARLRSAEKLTERQCECLDRAKLQAILENPLFERIISVVNARPEDVFREKQFTVFVHPSLTAEDGRQFREDRKQIVDGEVDLCFIEDGALVIVDYKTDRVRETEELRRHKPQLDLYEQAMTQILNLPVREKIVFSITLNDYIVV